MRFFVILLTYVIGLACASAQSYQSFQTGTLKGKLIVEWLEPDVFLFIPDAKGPLTFTRANGEVVQPRRMLTDGGSIPRPLRVFKNYSPWGYAPAFVVHDWIFHLKNCQLPGSDRYTLQDAGTVMAEIMKTMMETGKTEKDATTVELMYRAVTTPIAQNYWEKGRCTTAPPSFNGKSLYKFELSFP